MDIWQALVLGLVQGASEFLPVSSSGHLLLLEKLGMGEENLFFNVMLHVGTLFAVLIAMRKKWIPLARKPFNKTNGLILLACVPTVALAFLFKLLAPSLLDGKLLGCGFVLTACLLYASENFRFAKSTLLCVKTSILTGVLQGIAVLPGVSRSGATISALTLQGVDKESAADFSFLLSIPIIVGSALYESLDLMTGKVALDMSPWAIVAGVAASFVAGLVSIETFLKLIKKHSMNGFVLYTLALGIVVSILPLLVR
ncbi:MAG: undecaprenyl-diphosphate phosphatase [Christensenellales bacterium]